MHSLFPTNNAVNYIPQEMTQIKGDQQNVQISAQSGFQEVIDNNNKEKEKEKEKKRKQRIARLTFASGIVFLMCFFGLVLYDYISLSGGFTQKDLETFGQKLEFTLRYQALGLFPVAAIVQYIALRRVLGSAVDPTADNEHLIQKSKNILQNSLEQFVMSSMAQLILTTNLNADQILVYCPFMSVTLFIGRLIYIITYPNYRGFAFSVSFIPTFLAVVYSLLNVMI